MQFPSFPLMETHKSCMGKLRIRKVRKKHFTAFLKFSFSCMVHAWSMQSDAQNRRGDCIIHAWIMHRQCMGSHRLSMVTDGNSARVLPRDTCHFVLRHFNRCNFNRLHFQPFTLSTACLFDRLQIQPPQI